MRTCCIALLFTLATSFLYGGAGSTAELRDPKTGLAVDPPAGFTARIGEPVPGNMVEIVVEREALPHNTRRSGRGSFYPETEDARDCTYAELSSSFRNSEGSGRNFMYGQSGRA